MDTMHYTPISPFMRPISHAHLRVVERPEAPLPARPVNKWQLLRDLSKAQTAFGITERDLVVLQGLLGFHPAADLDGVAEAVVFASNAAICERLNGMACSTMRRHLARLVQAGLLGRRDSPNGKRYARRQGDLRAAFGLDLAPLWHRADEIAQAAEAVRAAEDRVRRLREAVSLMRRDLAALAAYGAELRPRPGFWDQLGDTAALAARALRRKLTLDDLTALEARLAALLDQARDAIDGPETEESSTSAARIGQHHLNSNTDSHDLEPALEKGGAAEGAPQDAGIDDAPARPPRIPLHLVVAACPALETFCPGPIRHWHQLHDAACALRPALGISVSAWQEAQDHMGPEQASVVVAAMLERFAEIRAPGGYLRALTAKARDGAFSCGPMVMALLGRPRAA